MSWFSFITAGINPEDFLEDSSAGTSALKNYWSLLTPLIFSDHPKRPGDEDPLPPFNMIRNVMDMNAHYGGLNAAFLEANNLVWVMNVVPIGAPNTLPLILDRGFAGVLHDWYTFICIVLLIPFGILTVVLNFRYKTTYQPKNWRILIFVCN